MLTLWHGGRARANHGSKEASRSVCSSADKPSLAAVLILDIARGGHRVGRKRREGQTRHAAREVISSGIPDQHTHSSLREHLKHSVRLSASVALVPHVAARTVSHLVPVPMTSFCKGSMKTPFANAFSSIAAIASGSTSEAQAQ